MSATNSPSPAAAAATVTYEGSGLGINMTIIVDPAASTAIISAVDSYYTLGPMGPYPYTVSGPNFLLGPSDAATLSSAFNSIFGLVIQGLFAGGSDLIAAFATGSITLSTS